jgi:hypothetical protein
MRRAPVAVAHGHAAAQHPAVVAGPGADAVFRIEGAPERVWVGELGPEAVDIVPMDQGQPGLRIVADVVVAKASMDFQRGE